MSDVSGISFVFNHLGHVQRFLKISLNINHLQTYPDNHLKLTTYAIAMLNILFSYPFNFITLSGGLDKIQGIIYSRGMTKEIKICKCGHEEESHDEDGSGLGCVACMCESFEDDPEVEEEETEEETEDEIDLGITFECALCDRPGCKYILCEECAI